MDEKNAEQTGDAQDQVDNSKRNIVAALLGSLGVAALSSCTNEGGSDGEGINRALQQVTGTTNSNPIRWVQTIGTIADPGELRTTCWGPQQQNGDVLIAEGFWQAGDGGGGVFYWQANCTENDDGGTIIAHCCDSPSGRWKRIYSGPLNVKWFGATGERSDHSPDQTWDTSFFGAAMGAAAGKGRALHIPGGYYRITAALPIITVSGFHVFGDGVDRTVIAFDPPVGTGYHVLFQWGTGTSHIYRGSIRNITIGSGADVGIWSPTSASRVAVKMADMTEFRLENVVVSFMQCAGSASIGFWTQGRDQLSVINLVSNADRPLFIDTNPTQGPGILDLDNANFHCLDMTCPLTAGGKLIEVANGVKNGPLSFTGLQAWVGGLYGFYWVDRTSTLTGQQITFENVRKECGANTEPGGAVFRIEKDGCQSLFHCAIRSCRGSSYAQGTQNQTFARFRGVCFVRLENCLYDGTGMFLDVDSTCPVWSYENYYYMAYGGSISQTSSALVLDAYTGWNPSPLPSANPGAGSRRLWYDPADGNRVKFAP